MSTLEILHRKNGSKPIKAALYARYSSNMQREESIDAQVRAIKDFAKKNNIDIVKEYIDKAISGTTDRRPDFQKMIADSANNLFQLLIVHKSDRFSRDQNDSFRYRVLLKKNNVSLCSVLEPYMYDDESTEGILFSNMVGAMNQIYIINLKKEVMKGLKENAYNCIHTGGCPPLGYDVDPKTKKYIINEEEAEAVRIIFRMTLERKHYSEILNCLNDNGYKTKAGNAFGKNSLFCILKNEKYTGVMIYNRTESRDPYTKKRNSSQIKPLEEQIRVPGGMPQIISPEDFHAVQEIIHTRKGRIKSIETYLLSGKIVCGICGASYNGNRKRSSGNRNPIMTYRCATNANKGKSGCSNKEINRNALEKYILEKIKTFLFDADRINETADRFQDYAKQQEQQSNDEINRLKRSLQEYETSKKRLFKRLAATESTVVIEGIETEIETITKKEASLKTQIEALETNKVILPDKETIKIYLQTAKKQLMTGSLPEIREIIDRFVDRIIVNRDTIEIVFKLISMARYQNSKEFREFYKTHAQNIAVLNKKDLKKYR